MIALKLHDVHASIVATSHHDRFICRLGCTKIALPKLGLRLAICGREHQGPRVKTEDQSQNCWLRAESTACIQQWRGVLTAPLRKALAEFCGIPWEQEPVKWSESQAIASHPLFEGAAIDRSLVLAAG